MFQAKTHFGLEWNNLKSVSFICGRGGGEDIIGFEVHFAMDRYLWYSVNFFLLSTQQRIFMVLIPYSHFLGEARLYNHVWVSIDILVSAASFEGNYRSSASVFFTCTQIMDSPKALHRHVIVFWSSLGPSHPILKGEGQCSFPGFR